MHHAHDAALEDAKVTAGSLLCHKYVRTHSHLSAAFLQGKRLKRGKKLTNVDNATVRVLIGELHLKQRRRRRSVSGRKRKKGSGRKGNRRRRRKRKKESGRKGTEREAGKGKEGEGGKGTEGESRCIPLGVCNQATARKAEGGGARVSGGSGAQRTYRAQEEQARIPKRLCVKCVPSWY